MIYRTQSIVSAAGLVLAAAGLALCLVAYSGRLAEAPEDVIQRNSQVHRCNEPGCLHCEVNRDFASQHPDANLGWPGQEIDGENATVIRFVEPAPTD